MPKFRLETGFTSGSDRYNGRMPKHTEESLRELVEKLRTERNNFKSMYENAKDRKHTKRLESKIAEQSGVIELLREQNALLAGQNETLKLRVDELERMVFGKHKRKDPPGRSEKDSPVSLPAPAGPKEKRPPFSYRRKTPGESEVTGTENIPVSACPDCGHALGKAKTVVRFSEDIPSLETLKILLRAVTKLSIGTGYCPHCRKRKSSVPIPPQTVSLGENVRALACYQSVIQNQSYSQISRFLSDFAGIAVSDGEIANVLEAEKARLVPECEAIRERIRNGGTVHCDETGHPVAKEEQGNYLWGMTNPGPGSEVAFLAGRSRGKGNAEELLGKGPEGRVLVSDDYGAYRNLSPKGCHGLCWAHPLRKFRDLKDSPSLKEAQRKRCAAIYGAFAKTYASLEKIRKEENARHGKTGEWRTERIAKAEAKLRASFRKLAIVKKGDPEKLKTLKESLAKNEDEYFVCLSRPGIPSDNNQAERMLRPLVLKRKISQGSKTQK